MARAAKLENVLGKWVKGSSFVSKLPAPQTIVAPRPSCLDTLPTRAKLALKRMQPGSKVFCEGVPVLRVEARRGMRFEIYSARYTLEQAVLEVMRIVEEREHEKEAQNAAANRA